MAAGSEKNADFYAVLGLKKECSDSELRNAYKKLALKWHPDRCSGSGDSEFVKEAKEKFQAIQEAYSILSDSNKRFLYDAGIYENDDDENGMCDFLDEMVQMMTYTKSNGNGQDSFEDLQQLFADIFQADRDLTGLSSGQDTTAMTTSSSSNTCCNPAGAVCGGGGGKRPGSSLSSAASKAKLEELSAGSIAFCFGADEGMPPLGGNRGGSRRNGRNQKASSKHDISSKDAGISA